MGKWNKLYNFLFSSKVLSLLAVATLVVFIISLFNRYIYIDDAWLGEQAWWFLMDGIARTETIKGFRGWDTQLFVYHKATIVIGAILIKIFGWSVESLRLFSLAIYVLFFVVLFKFFRNNQSIYSTDHFLLAAFIVFVNPLTLLYSYTFRPEILVSLLGFSSFLFIDLFIIKSPKNKYLIFSGLLAGLSFLFHANGLVFSVAGFLLLAFMKKPKPAFIFGISSVLTASLYFIDLWQPGHLQAYFYQMNNWPVAHTSNYVSGNVWDWIVNILKKLANEQQRFFWSYKVWGVSALFILALILKWKKVIKIKRHLLIYLLLLALSLNLLGSQIAERYLIYYLPYMAIIVAVMIFDLRSDTKNYKQGIVIVLLFFQMICVGIGFYDIFDQNDNYVDQHEQILARIPEKSAPVLVSYRFIFNALEDRQLVTYKSFEYHQVELGRKLGQEEFLARASQLGIKYIVVPGEMLSGSDSRFPFLMDGEIDINPYYESYFAGPDYRIFKSKNL
jgi:4-amino-4-deoxy-L-arabinose transferase-like glycosyltransferase